MVCNDPRVAEYIRENYVAVATNDLDYVVTEQKDKLEYDLMQKLYSQSPYEGAYQGILLASSNGKLFEHFAGFDPDDALRALKDAKEAYDAMDRDERVLAKQLGPEDKMRTWSPPREGVIDIRVTKRSLPDERFPDTDQRHSKYFHFDYLWLKPSELVDFVPAKVERGAVRRLSKKYVVRFGLTNLLTPEPQHWQLEHLKRGDLRTVVTAVKEDGVHLRLEGEFALDAKTESNDSAYDGRLLGKMVISPDRKKLVKFEAVALGDADVRKRLSHLHPGPGDSKAGAVFEFNGKTDNDKFPPSGWQIGYQDF